MWEWHGYGGGFMWFFWIILIVLVAWAVSAGTRGDSGANGSESDKSPLEILQQRYARGEIDQQEYQQKRKDLGA